MDSTMKLNSQIDASVNFIEEQLVGFLESRYVRKVDNYFICYLSSQTGCNRGCKFCHLTVTKQISFTDATIEDFMRQWRVIEEHYLASERPTQYVHFNFMARGEPLANKYLLREGDQLLHRLGKAAKYLGLKAKFNISTILPQTLNQPLEDIFQYIHPTIYYSLYSINKSFRQKWMPGAMGLDDALYALKCYQAFSKKIVKIHHAFIQGENDSEGDVEDMCTLLNQTGLIWEFNLVRYNPFSSEQGVETDPKRLGELLDLVTFYAPGKVQMIPRVGRDVFASCGTFYNDES